MGDSSPPSDTSVPPVQLPSLDDPEVTIPRRGFPVTLRAPAAPESQTGDLPFHPTGLPSTVPSVNPRPDGARSRLSFGTTGGFPVLASPSDPAIRPLHHPPTTPAAASISPLSSSDSRSRVQETINRLQRPLHGSSFVPILEDPADVITNISVLSRDAPEFYEKHKKKVTILGDALDWYSKHRPEFITALDAASCQTSSVGYHAIGVALRDLVLHHGWQQSSALAFVCKIMARPSSPMAALANLVIKGSVCPRTYSSGDPIKSLVVCLPVLEPTECHVGQNCFGYSTSSELTILVTFSILPRRS